MIDEALKIALHRYMLKERGIRYKDLAEELGFTRAAVTNYFNGEYANRPQTWDQIDAAITRITDKRGGVDKMFPPEERAARRAVIREGRLRDLMAADGGGRGKGVA